ncbi:MAG TPA: hypothetical protein VKV04_19050, partial [Verrucomicrobiae bacterium]|nr:hypothetical protein [Verrucomicrobiae bacterium]
QATYADWGASKLKRLGLANDLVEPVPCWVRQRDRTYHSAVAVRKWFEGKGIAVRSIDLLSYGPHARRSRLLFERALGKNVRVGIVAADVQDYDSQRWWRSSEGVRDVVGEAIAYLYARVTVCFLESEQEN